MKVYENMHVLLLKGGDGYEREVSLKTALDTFEFKGVTKKLRYPFYNLRKD